VDRLIVDEMREHARVLTLVGKMEALTGRPLPRDVHEALRSWHDSIKAVQIARRDEIINTLPTPSPRSPHPIDEKGTLFIQLLSEKRWVVTQNKIKELTIHIYVQFIEFLHEL
jgi:hypothetical protein